MRKLIVQLFLFALMFSTARVPRALAQVPQRLERLSIDPAKITMSGLSSGAFMTVQFHLAHAKIIAGAAAVAGGVYDCAQGSSLRAQSLCMETPENVDVAASITRAEQNAREGRIDDLSLIASSRVYLLQGKNDKRLKPAAGDKLVEFYTRLMSGAPARSLRYEDGLQAAHGLPTMNFGADCVKGGAPYLLNCGFDTAREILAHLSNGKLASPAMPRSESLVRFDQLEFGSNAAGMYPSGALYVPERCRSGATACALHVSLHGCKQNPDFIGDQWEQHAGFNAYAEGNDIVILYPKAAVSSRNPNACWDWFGYTGAEYATKNGAQIKVLRQMIERLTGV